MGSSRKRCRIDDNRSAPIPPTTYEASLPNNAASAAKSRDRSAPTPNRHRHRLSAWHCGDRTGHTGDGGRFGLTLGEVKGDGASRYAAVAGVDIPRPTRPIGEEPVFLARMEVPELENDLAHGADEGRGGEGGMARAAG